MKQQLLGLVLVINFAGDLVENADQNQAGDIENLFKRLRPGRIYGCVMVF